MKTGNKINLANVIVAIIGIIVGLFSGKIIEQMKINSQINQSGVIINNYDKQSDIIEVLIENYVDANNQITQLKNSNNLILADKEKLQADIESLTEQYNNIYAENEDLQKDNKRLQKENYELNKFIDDSKPDDEDIPPDSYVLPVINDVEETTELSDKKLLLADMDYMALYLADDQSFYNKEPNLKDCTGEYHSNAIISGIRCLPSERDTNNYLYVDNFLDKKYKNFKCTIVIPDEYKTCDDVYVVYFYGYSDEGTDNNFTIKSDEIRNGSLPYEYEISVENIVKFRIEVVRQELNAGGSAIALVDAEFYNNGHT